MTHATHEPHWRKRPSVKRLVFKAVPDASTRLAMLKRGEVDVAYAVNGELGEEVRRTPGLTLRPTPFVATHWLLFADQWDPGSPWRDRRVRLAATHAVNRPAINQAVTLGFSRITGSIIPTSFDFYWQPPLLPHDPSKARQLLTEAGYPKGFDVGDFWCDASACTYAEPVLNDLAVGIKTRLRPLKRAGFLKAYQEKKLRNIIYGLSGIFGNAATRLEPFVVSSGAYAYGGTPTSTGSSRSRRASWTRRSARPCSIASSNSSTTRPWSCRSGSSPCSRGSAPAWRNRGSASSPTIRGRRRTRT